MTILTTKKDWPEIFLDKLRKAPNITTAARAAGITRQAAYLKRETDLDFAAAWDEALLSAIENAEGEMYRRAVKGTIKPIFQNGARVGSVREYSDTLLIFMLKAHKPEIYRETVRNETTGKDGEPLTIRIEYVDAETS